MSICSQRDEQIPSVVLVDDDVDVSCVVIVVDDDVDVSGVVVGGLIQLPSSLQKCPF